MKFKQFLVGLLCGGMIIGGIPTIAKTGKKTIDVVFNNISLEVNGIKTQMPDGVEPFLYEGTTYIPIRAVATAFAQDARYDKSTNTIYVGSKKQATNDGSIMLSDYIKEKPLYDHYNNGIKYYVNDGTHYYKSNQNKYTYTSEVYPYYTSGLSSSKLRLDSNFSRLKGQLLISDNEDGSPRNGSLEIYSVNAKGEVLETLYTTDNLPDDYQMGSGWVSGFDPINLDIDLTGVEILQIKLNTAVILDPRLVPIQ